MDDDNASPADLGHLDPKWQGFRILNGLLWTPNGYFYRPGDIYVIPIHAQLIATLRREATTPKQLLL